MTRSFEGMRPMLDQGAAELYRSGALVGHLTSVVEAWGLFRPIAEPTSFQFLVTLTDGDQCIIEEYPPYATIPELLEDKLEAEWTGDFYDVVWLEGERREAAWEHYGIHESPGTYRFWGTMPVSFGTPIRSRLAKMFRRPQDTQ